MVELLKVVGGKELPVIPLKPKPPNVLLDCIHVFEVFAAGIGIIEAQVTRALVVGGDAEVEADGLGVPDMEIAVWLGWKAGRNPPVMLVCLQIFIDDSADEINRRLFCQWCPLLILGQLSCPQGYHENRVMSMR